MPCLDGLLISEIKILHRLKIISGRDIFAEEAAEEFVEAKIQNTTTPLVARVEETCRVVWIFLLLPESVSAIGVSLTTLRRNSKGMRYKSTSLALELVESSVMSIPKNMSPVVVLMGRMIQLDGMLSTE